MILGMDLRLHPRLVHITVHHLHRSRCITLHPLLAMRHMEVFPSLDRHGIITMYLEALELLQVGLQSPTLKTLLQN